MASATNDFGGEYKQEFHLANNGILRNWLLIGPFDRNAVDKNPKEAHPGILDVLKKMTDAELIEIRSVTKERRLSRVWVRRYDPELADRFERLDIGLAEDPKPAAKPDVDESSLRPSDGEQLSSAAVVGGIVEWFPVAADGSGYVDLARALWQYEATPMANLAGKQDGSTGYMACLAAYAAVYIDAPAETTVDLHLKWNGQGAIILNGQALEQLIKRSTHLKSEDSWQLPLRQGENLLLIRLAGPNEQGPQKRNWGWGFAASFANADTCKFYLPLSESRAPLSAELHSTPFFVRTEEGASAKGAVSVDGEENLLQIFHLAARYYGETAQGMAVLRTEGFEQSFDLGRVSPGLTRFDIPFPPVSSPMPADLRVKVGGQEFAFVAELTPSVRYTILVTESSHLDTGFTDPQDQVSDIRIRILDDCLRFIDEEKDPDFHFTEEGMWSVQQFMEARSPEKVERLMQLVREGRIELAAMNSSVSPWTTGDEELCREFARAKDIHEKYKVPITSALFIDTPGVGWGLSEVLYRSGVRYLVNGMNESFNGRSFETTMPREFWWETPSGGRILVSAYRGYYAPIDLHPNGGIDALRHILNQRIHEKEADKEPGDFVYFFGSNYDNVLPDLNCAKAFREWNSRYAYPKFVLTTVTKAMEHMEKSAGDKLPVLRGDWGGYWDSSHHAATTDCRIRENLLLAEKLFSIMSLHTADASPHAELMRQAYDLQIDSKTHGATGTAFGTDEEVEQANRWFAARREMSESLAEGLVTRAIRNAGNLLASQKSGHHLVFNPSSWARDGIVDILSRTRLNHPTQSPVTEGDKESNAIALRDTETGEIIPLHFEAIQSRTFMGAPREGTRAQFIARNVPPMGFRAYEVISFVDEGKSTSDLSAGSNWIENRNYRVEVSADGIITSLFDKRLQRELLDRSSATAFGETKAVESPRGGWKPAPKALETDANTSEPEIKVQVVDHSPVCVALVVEQKKPISLRTEVYLLPGSDTVFFRDVISSGPADPQGPQFRSITKNFPLSISSPHAVVKVSNALITPGVDQLPGAGHRGTYIPQYGGELNNQEWGITWAAFGVSHMQYAGCSLDQLRRPPLPDNPTLRFSASLPGGRGSRQSHHGPVSISYALRGHAGSIDKGEIVRLGLELAQPLLHIEARGHDGIADPAPVSYFSTDQKDAAIQTVKACENGKGYCLRLYNAGDQDIKVMVKSPYFRNAKAYLSDLLERRGKKLRVQEESLIVPMPGRSVITVLFFPEKI